MKKGQRPKLSEIYGKGLPPKAKELLEKLEKAGKEGLTAPEMGELFFGPEDTLSDRDLIEWTWEEREIKEGKNKGKKAWMKVCRICKD